MKHSTIHLFTERVTFLKRILTLTEEGDFEENWQDLESLWAMVHPIPVRPVQSGEGWHVIEKNKGQGLYKIVMRKNTIRNALHADLKVLLWKCKILEILFPFRRSSSPHLLEAVAVDYGKERKNG